MMMTTTRGGETAALCSFFFLSCSSFSGRRSVKSSSLFFCFFSFACFFEEIVQNQKNAVQLDPKSLSLFSFAVHSGQRTRSLAHFTLIVLGEVGAMQGCCVPFRSRRRG